MLKLEFTPEIIKQLEYERYNHPHSRVQRKMQVLHLKAQGLSNKEILKQENICENTLLKYLFEYQEGGVERLKEIRFRSQKSELAAHTTTIEDYFKENPPATLKEAAAKIEELTGIKRSPSRIGVFLKKLGLKPRKVGMIPAKADVEAQNKFLKEELKPRIEETQEGKRVLYFVDAAHFVLSPFLGFLWSFTRIFLKAPSGRQRFNVLGALNVATYELLTVKNDSYINADCVCELLTKIAEQYSGVPISIVLDNARYQRCRKVQDYAQQLGIELLFLPPYSPNLNLIERLWKFVKKKCLYSKYYEKFDGFKTAITNCLDKTNTEYKKELETLLRPNFQTFKNVQVVAS